MSERERASFSAAEIREIGRLLKLEHPWQFRHLREVLASLPDTAASVRTIHFEKPLWSAEVFLRQVEANPGRRLRLLLKPTAGELQDEVFAKMLQHHRGLAQLHYHVAKLISPTGNAEEELKKGSARIALLAFEDNVVLIGNAAKSARLILANDIRRGKGADRRSRDTPRDLFVSHLLEFYRDVTGKLPGVTNKPGVKRIEGPAVQFLRLALPRFGFQATTGSTMRRWIDEFRRWHRRLAKLNNLG